MPLLCGKASAKAAENNSSINQFETKAELSDFLQHNPIKDALILIKASRGMGLETLVKYL